MNASRAVLARPAGRDHAACGVGLVARVSGEPDREVVELALGALTAMEHRGGVGADGEASDGAGVLTAIPWRVLEPWLAEQRVAEPRPFSTAVGMVFLPREPGKRNLARELVAKACATRASSWSAGAPCRCARRRCPRASGSATRTWSRSSPSHPP